MQLLEEDELVTRKPGSGTYVAQNARVAADDIAETTSPMELVEVRAALEPVQATAKTGIGVAGTITSIAALDLGLAEYDRERVDKHRLTLQGVDKQLARLAAMTTAERRELPAFEPKRAPVIVAGTVILRETMAHFGLDEIEISERDILDGAALEAARLPEPEEGEAPPGAYTCC